MLDLQEFKLEVYEEFLREQEENELKEILKEQEQTVRGLEALKEWFELENNESLNEEEKLADLLAAQVSSLKDVFKSGVEAGKGLQVYNPTPNRVEVKTLTNTKFPDNIILFINSIVKWVKNVALKLIDSFTRLIRRTFGFQNDFKENQSVSWDDLKLNFKSAKEIQDRHMVELTSDKGTLKLDNLTQKDLEVIAPELNKSGVYKSVMGLTEDITNPSAKSIKDVTVAQIDVSKDLFTLKEALSHFFDLFDSSIGSNNEMLFGTSDLELFLDSFKKAYEAITGGGETYYAVDGEVTSTDIISSDRLRDNLVRTKINTDKLRLAYSETEKVINNIVNTINAKQYVASSAIGLNWRLMSAASYKQLIEIIDVIKKREKEAAKLEKKLKKMYEVYGKLLSSLEKIRHQYMQITANTTFSTLAQKRVADLYDAAKYMTQTVSLRLLTLGVYLKSIQNTKELLISVNNINRPNRNYSPVKIKFSY